MRGSLDGTRGLLHCGHCRISFTMLLEIPDHQTEVKAHRRHLCWMPYEVSMRFPQWLQLGPYLLLVQPPWLGELNHPATQWVLHLCTAVDF